MSELLTLYSQMKQEFRQVVTFFGEDPAQMRVDDFFGIFASFTTDFQVDSFTSEPTTTPPPPLSLFLSCSKL